MKIVNFKTLVGTLCCAVLLTSCGGDKDTSSSSNSTTSSGSTKGKVVYSVVNKKVVTKGNPARPDQGLYCSIGMRAENKTERDISLLQIMKFTAVTAKGNVSDHASNMRLDVGEVDEFGAAIGVDRVACEDIQKIIIEQVFCNNSGIMRGQPNAECVEDVIFQGSKKIKIEVAEGALKNTITVTP